MGKLLYVLPTVAARGSQLFSGEFGHDVNFFDLAASVFDHLGNGSLFGAETAHCLLHIAASVEFSIASHHTTPDCKV